jgi:cytochrome c55X
MLSGTGFAALAALAVLALSSLVSPASADTGAAGPTPARQKELIHLVRQECGFCHGLRLTGGLGSPLTAQAMQGKPAESLEAVIRYGIPGTAMPGWEPFLTETETRWIVQHLQQGFPNDH